jgi:hypothetical protein
MIQVVVCEGIMPGHPLSKFGTNQATGRGGILIMANFRKHWVGIALKLHYFCPK